MAVNIDIRSNLVVGLGGTGTTVLTWLKAQLLDNIGPDIFNVIGLLALDTDARLPEVRRQNGQIAKLSPNEFIHIGNVPTARIITNLENYKTIAAWMPKDVPLPAINQGARMVRMLGRMALYYYYAEIANQIKELALNIRSYRLSEQTIGNSARSSTTGTATLDASMNTFLVSSICGGTGAGTFLDMAYIMRHVIQEALTFQEQVHFNGVLVLPSVFKIQSLGRLQANAKAALDDLDELMVNGFRAVYPGNVEINYPLTQPFDVCYLVDAVDGKQGKTINGIDELAPLLATSIYLQLASQVGPANRSRFDNVDSRGHNFKGHITAYSGLGCARLVFPAKEIIEHCGLMFCHKFITEQLLPPAPKPEDVSKLVNGFMDVQLLTRDMLLTDIKNNPRGQKINTGLNPQMLKGVATDQVPDRIRRAAQKQDKDIDTTIAAQMESNRALILERVQTALQAQVEQLTNDPAYGLITAIAFLEGLEQEIADRAYSLSETRARLVESLAGAESKSNEALPTLTAAVSNRLPIWRNMQVDRAGTDYLRSEDARLRFRLELVQHERVLTLLGMLRDLVVAERRTYVNLRERLENLAQRLERRILSGQDFNDEILPFTWSVVDKEEATAYYNRFVPPRSTWLTLAVQSCGSIATWRQNKLEGIERSLLSFARTPFAPIDQINIEEVIGEGEPGSEGIDIEGADETDNNYEKVQAALSRLRSNAQPYWKRSVAIGEDIDRLPQVDVVGVPVQEVSAFANKIRAGEELVSTGDVRTISMLKTEHGLPSIALNDYAAYTREYDNYQAASSFGKRAIPLRLFDPATRKQPIKDLDRVPLAFALGQVFDYIKQNEEGVYSFRRPDPTAAGGWRSLALLSRDLADAVTKFGQHADYVEEVELVARNHRAEYGKKGAQEKVQGFLQSATDQSTYDAEKRQELQNAAKRWAEISEVV